MKDQNQLINEIIARQHQSESLEVPFTDRRFLLKIVNNYTDTFLTKLSVEKAYEKEGYEKSEEDEQLEINNKSNSIQDLLHLVESRVDKPGLNPASGRHFGYIPGGGLYASALGDYIAAITNRYAGVFYASPGAVRLENSLIRWTGNLIGYKGDFAGNLTSGGSYANLIALFTAKTAHKIKGKDLENAVIYVCRQAHHSILKALKVTGLDECVIRIIDMDNNFKMDLKTLKNQLKEDVGKGLKPFLLCANAGSTDMGAIDPLFEMAAIAKRSKMWFHVDAAYGGFFILTKDGKEKLKGIELADSVIMDPHKGLFIPYGLGILLVKNAKHLLEANSFDANYMQDTKTSELEYSPNQLSPELSKHFRGMRMWLPLKLHGTLPFAASLEEKILLTHYFYQKVKELGFKTGPFPDLSIVVFWYEPAMGDINEYNKRILKTIQEDGNVFISSTLIDGKFLLRFAALSFRTHLKEVNALLKILGDCVS
ncbi:MAG: aminotransferase class V-fold PLP-dependent enzyme [Ginsengibacter sp.]